MIGTAAWSALLGAMASFLLVAWFDPATITRLDPTITTTASHSGEQDPVPTVHAYHEVSVTAVIRRSEDQEPVDMARRYGDRRPWAAVYINAKAPMNDDGTMVGVRVNARGYYYNEDGTLSNSRARMDFGSLSDLPDDLADALQEALEEEAAKITVTP